MPLITTFWSDAFMVAGSYVQLHAWAMELAYSDLPTGVSDSPWISARLVTSVTELLMQPSGPNVCAEMPALACSTIMWPCVSNMMLRGCVSLPAILVSCHPSAMP